MRILYICHRFPYPPVRGGKIRPFNMIRHLGRRHRVTVVSLVRAQQEAAEAAGIRDFCTDYEMVMVRDDVQTLRMMARLPTRSPSSFGFFHSEDVARAVRRRLREARYDLIRDHIGGNDVLRRTPLRALAPRVDAASALAQSMAEHVVITTTPNASPSRWCITTTGLPRTASCAARCTRTAPAWARSW